jgi:hypothetical protein
MCGITEPDSNGDCNSQVENGTASLLPQIDKKSRHPAIVADVIPVQVCKYACILPTAPAISHIPFMVNMQSCMTGVKRTKKEHCPAAEMSRS